MRTAGGLIAGILAGFLAIFLIAMVGEWLFPASTVDVGGLEQIVAAFPRLPLAAKLIIILSWFGGALAGAGVAKKISGSATICWIVAALFTLYVLASVLILPMPGWLQAIAILAPLLGGLIANHLVRGPAAAPRPIDAPA